MNTCCQTPLMGAFCACRACGRSEASDSAAMSRDNLFMFVVCWLMLRPPCAALWPIWRKGRDEPMENSFSFGLPGPKPISVLQIYVLFGQAPAPFFHFFHPSVSTRGACTVWPGWRCGAALQKEQPPRTAVEAVEGAAGDGLCGAVQALRRGRQASRSLRAVRICASSSSQSSGLSRRSFLTASRPWPIFVSP